jgi:hypothetical protein
VSLYLSATFAAKATAIQAIEQLKASGYGPADLTVFSAEPLEFPPGVLDRRPSHMSLAVVSGAAAVVLRSVGVV